SACAWYCMRALRPRSARATTTALIREKREGGAGILRCFPERAVEQLDNGRGLAADPGAAQIRLEDGRVDVRFPADRFRVAETLGDAFDGSHDVALGFGLGHEAAAVGQCAARQQ